MLPSRAGSGGKHTAGQELTVLQGWHDRRKGGKDFVLLKKQQVPDGAEAQQSWDLASQKSFILHRYPEA